MSTSSTSPNVKGRDINRKSSDPRPIGEGRFLSEKPSAGFMKEYEPGGLGVSTLVAFESKRHEALRSPNADIRVDDRTHGKSEDRKLIR